MISQGNTEKNPKTLLMSPELKDAQSLMPMSDVDRKNLKADIETNGMRHPIIAYRKEGGYYILAGWNRREIALELNIPLVAVQIVEGSAEEYKSFVITENFSRRHLTTEQKGALIKYLLKADSSQSNGSIAKKAGVSKSTVQSKRVELESGGQIEHLHKTTGSDGKKYKKAAGVQIGHLKGKDVQSSISGKEKKPVDTKESECRAIISSIKEYLNKVIKSENVKLAKEKSDGKSFQKSIKIEGRHQAFCEVLSFIKNIE